MAKKLKRLEISVHTNATRTGPWETFGVKWLGQDKIALRTPDGRHYVTAVNGGGMGSIGDSQAIHTNATAVGPDQLFTLTFTNNHSTVTLQTANGHYLTAVDCGGCGGANSVPIHTDATSVGAWETFSLRWHHPPPTNG